MYSKQIMQRFSHPKFHKKLEKINGIGKVGNPKCGDVMEIYIHIEEKIIKNISFLTYGCVAAIVSSDCLCELAKGKSLEEAKKLTKQDIINALGGDIPPVKVHCSLLAIDALKKAIEDYEKK